jgi:hypothetical protein
VLVGARRGQGRVTPDPDEDPATGHGNGMEIGPAGHDPAAG